MYIVDVSFYNIDFYRLQSTMFTFKCHRAILESTWFDVRKKIEDPSLGRLIINNYYAEFQTACDHRDVKFELLYLITYFILSRLFFIGKGRYKNVQMMSLSFFHAGQEDL